MSVETNNTWASCDAALLWEGARVELRALQKSKVRMLHVLMTRQCSSLMFYTEGFFLHTFAAFCKREIYIPTVMNNSQPQI